MSYIDENLLPDETIILRGKIHWILLVQAALLFFAAYLALAHFEQRSLDKIMHVVILVKSTLGMTSTPEQVSSDQHVVVLLISLLLFIIACAKLVQYFCTEVAVTNKRFILKRGLIKRDTSELNLNRVTGLNVDQSVMGRMLNYGDMTVESMGGFFGTPATFIVDPLTFRKVLLAKVERPVAKL